MEMTQFCPKSHNYQVVEPEFEDVILASILIITILTMTLLRFWSAVLYGINLQFVFLKNSTRL